LLGWKSMGDHHSQNLHRNFVAGAARFEPGTLNVLGLVGLHAALRLFEMVGSQQILERLGALRRRFISGALSLGYAIHGGAKRNETTCITTIACPSRDLTSVRSRLERHSRQIVLSQRELSPGVPALRFAPHFYNTPAEVDALLEVLA
jgi:cysteine desulfurase / selenocysteine lyase